jgi:outer membrane protein assembly factor BamB
MRLPNISVILVVTLLLTSCFIGPVKELGYQIEDSFGDQNVDIDNPSQLIELKNKYNLKINYKFNIGSLSKKNLFFTSTDNKVFIVNSDRELYCLDITTGNRIFKREVTSGPLSGISSNLDSLFFVDLEGYLNSYDLEGNIQWKSYVGEVMTKPIADNKNVYLKTISNTFLAINNIDGSILWIYQAPTPPLILRSWGDIVINENHIISGISSGKIISIEKNSGFLKWETTFSEPKGVSEIDRANDITSAPIYDGSIIYVVSSKGHLSAIENNEGIVLWKRPFSSFNGIILDQNELFSVHKSGAIYAFDKNTGDVLWRNADLKGRDITKGILIDDSLIVSDYQGYLHFINRHDGKINSRFQLSDYPFLDYFYTNANKDGFLVLNSDGDLFSVSFLATEKNKSNKNNDTSIISDLLD